MKVISKNKKAYFNYFIEDTLEAGLVLQGTEIKAIRLGNVSLKDCYVRIKEDEAFVVNMHIAPYLQGNQFNHEPLRTRKLLLNKKEITKLEQQLKEDGLTIVVTKVYFGKSSKVKLEIGVGRGKKLYDKRQDLKEKDAKREMDKALKYY